MELGPSLVESVPSKNAGHPLGAVSDGHENGGVWIGFGKGLESSMELWIVAIPRENSNIGVDSGIATVVQRWQFLLDVVS